MNKKDMDDLLEQFEKMLDDGAPVLPKEQDKSPVAESFDVDDLDFGYFDMPVSPSLDALCYPEYDEEEINRWCEAQDQFEIEEELSKAKKRDKVKSKKCIKCECGGAKTQTPHFRWCPIAKLKKA